MNVSDLVIVEGVSIPSFLYGTAWKEDNTSRCVEDALQRGFRGIDTANQRKHYFEKGVGVALQKIYGLGKISRKDLFLQTKFTSLGGQDQRLPYDSHASLSDQVAQSFESSLEHLSTDYLDSYVLHGPMSSAGWYEEDKEVWRAMEKLKTSGKTKLLGVSNVSLPQLEALMKDCKVKPSFVQNRCYARRGWDKHIREFCKANGIIYQGFSLLTANQDIFRNPIFVEIYQRMGCTPAQLVFRFSQLMGMLPLTGTTSGLHMKEDLGCESVEISEADLETIEQISV